MKLVAYFNLRLRAGRTISYADLREIWHSASRCAEVGLRKTAIGRDALDAACVYTLLCAPRDFTDLVVIESRLRSMLDEQRVGPAVMLTRLG